MTVQVQTYECEETVAEHVECESAAVELIEQLGLAGQRDLLARHAGADGDTTKRCPYRKMEADEQFIYRQLCPQRGTLEKYSAGPIPLRVLQVAAHAKSLNFFETLEVWARESAAVDDPVLVGIHKPAGASWGRELFILARWGEALDELPAMMKSATAAWLRKAKAKVAADRTALREFESKLVDVDFDGAMAADKYLTL